MKTVIMAGGFGTRISSLFPDIPKPLIPISSRSSSGEVCTKPVLEWEIESLASQGFTDIIITVSYMADKIIEYFGDGKRFGVSIDYYREEQPLGNAGALFKMLDKLGEESFLLLNGDAVFDVDFGRMVSFHNEKKAAATLFTHPNSHPYDSGLIIADSNHAVTQWLSKEDIRPEYYKNRVNAGLHVIDPKTLSLAAFKKDPDLIGTEVNGKRIKVDLDRDVLKPLCGTGRMFAYDSPEYVKDMGTPERYEQVCRDFMNGVVRSKRLTDPQRAIFLDRDGTINKYVGFLRNIDDLELFSDTAEAIRKINNSRYLAVVVTNQPVIARGEVTYEQLDEIHNKLETLLGSEGAYIDALYYCPHHPDSGFDGEIAELKIDCNCRKPKPGMLLRAAEDYNIDLSESYIIGDSENDILAGKAAGCRTVLLGSGDYGADLSAETLLDAVRIILKDCGEIFE